MKTTTLRGALAAFDDDLRSGRTDALTRAAVGFPLLDEVLGGGLRPGELLLLSGPPGAGKTVAALQWARNLARAGREAVYVSYEHEEAELLLRLVSLEVGEQPGTTPADVEKLRLRLSSAAAVTRGALADQFPDREAGQAVVEALDSYGDRMHLVAGSGRSTGVDDLEACLSGSGSGGAVLVVDYLQKIAVVPEPPDESEKVTRSVEALKDLALRRQIPIVAIVAADKEGLRTRRMRLHHLRGSSALAYECDVAVMLNEKMECVSKVHLAYDPVRANTFREWVVFSIEKNRGGPNRLDLEFRKDFAHFRFDPEGGIVTDRLVDERLDVE